jgi:hypothetical protein
MLSYCPVPAFDGYVALPIGCNVDAVVQRFIEDYKLYDFRWWLWRIAKAAITNDDFDSDEREDLIHFLHELECVMEVVYLDWSQESLNHKIALKS